MQKKAINAKRLKSRLEKEDNQYLKKLIAFIPNF